MKVMVKGGILKVSRSLASVEGFTDVLTVMGLPGRCRYEQNRDQRGEQTSI
jgi:hypothetical protein